MAKTKQPSAKANLLKTFSLENLGLLVGDNRTEDDEYNLCLNELVQRVDRDLEAAKGLFDYHVTRFKADPSSKHWNELLALMATVSTINWECPES